MLIKKILSFSLLTLLALGCKTTSPEEKVIPPQKEIPQEFKSRYKDYKQTIEKLKEEAQVWEANLFYPELYQEALAREKDMDQAFEDMQEESLTRNAQKAIEILVDIIKTTKDNKDRIAFLKEVIEKELANKEANPQNYQDNASTYECIHTQYFKGSEHYRNKNMEGALEAFSAAYYACHKLLSSAQVKDEQEAIRLAAEKQLKELERVSALKVADNQGKIVKPKSWSGYDYLNDKNKQVELLTKVKREESASLNTAIQTVEDLLNQARQSWELAVAYNEDGQTQLAKEELFLSRQYSNTYAEYAILDVYLVKAHQRPIDTLWKIAKIYYKDPYSWPMIWIRNRALIKDPDLILPGWKIMQDPKDIVGLYTARYEIGYLRYKNGQYEEAQKTLLPLLEVPSSVPNWIPILSQEVLDKVNSKLKPKKPKKQKNLKA
ncbi:UNVERIFIED_CONTAM: hypothetical protein PYX00_010914 [Menopon gallinae]|uniref:LysM domain-containing protein n=1 Tax=Menopon gallinae TaxID=328185 RepID=A0AAW2H6W7_9NEOP